ncbi:MAG: hypothetical protein J6A89_01515 [Clostridia bacterium]|nr:hypothetical protein [Clostridia bacterium]
MNLKIKKTDIFYIFLYINVFCKGIGLDNSSKIYLLLICFGIAAIFLKIANDKFTKREIIITTSIMLVGLGTFVCTKRPTFLLTCITLAGMKNINIDRTFKGMFIIRLTTFIVIISLSLLGIIDNEMISMYRNGGVDIRYSLGYGHPNTAQINLFIILALYIYIRFEKLNILDYAAIIGTNYFIYSYTLSRTGFICGLLLVGLTIYSKIRKKDELLVKFPKVIFLVMFSFSIVTAILYGHLEIMNKLDIIFNGRIGYSNYYWNVYGISLFGKNLIEDTNALFDNGYLFFMIQYGISCLGVIMYLFFKLFNNVKLTNNVKQAIIIIPFLIYILTESFAPNIFMNIIILLSAPLIFNKEEKECLKNEI